MQKNFTSEPAANASAGDALSYASTLIDRLEAVGEVLGVLDMMVGSIEDCYRLPFRRIIDLAEAELAFARGLVENDGSRLRATAEKMRAGAAASVPASSAKPVKKVTSDPLLDAIAAYRKGEADYNAIKEDDWPARGGEGEVIRKSYGEPLGVLQEWSVPATTREAAIEALRFAHEENQVHYSNPTVVAMVAAALAFFESEEV